MKTTINITVEKVESGHRVKINHDGNQLEHPAIVEVDAALREYWQAIEMQENAVESLRIMKAKRKNMKKFINDSVDWLNICQGEGMLRKKPDESCSDVPF